MKLLPRLPTSIFCLLAMLFFASAARGQSSALNRTDLGKSLNTDADLANSLIPGPYKYGKGEKKQEVDPKTLESKKTKDPLFEGGLNDVGLDWTATNKMGKPQTGKAEDSKTQKVSNTPVNKEVSKESESATDKQSSKSTEAADNQHKEHPADTGEKPAEKASPSKADGNR